MCDHVWSFNDLVCLSCGIRAKNVVKFDVWAFSLTPHGIEPDGDIQSEVITGKWPIRYIFNNPQIIDSLVSGDKILFDVVSELTEEQDAISNRLAAKIVEMGCIGKQMTDIVGVPAFEIVKECQHEFVPSYPSGGRTPGIQMIAECRKCGYKP